MKSWVIFFLLVFSVGSAHVTKFSIFILQDVGGLERDLQSRVDLLERERKEWQFHMTWVHGNFLSPLFLSRDNQVVDWLGRLKTSVVSLGDQELMEDRGCFEKRRESSSFRWLGVNLIDNEGSRFTSTPQVQRYDVEGIRVAVFSVTEKESSLFQETPDWYFLPSFPVVLQVVEDLKKEGVDVIVLCSHLTQEKQRELARQISGIDLILGSHGETPFAFYEKETLIYNASYFSSSVTRMDLVLEKKEKPYGSIVSVYPCWKQLD